MHQCFFVLLFTELLHGLDTNTIPNRHHHYHNKSLSQRGIIQYHIHPENSTVILQSMNLYSMYNDRNFTSLCYFNGISTKR